MPLRENCRCISGPGAQQTPSNLLAQLSTLSTLCRGKVAMSSLKLRSLGVSSAMGRGEPPLFPGGYISPGKTLIGAEEDA